MVGINFYTLITQCTFEALTSFGTFITINEFRERFQASAAVWFKAVFLNRRAAARYRALASIIPGRER
jgi:hypothetical protein